MSQHTLQAWWLRMTEQRRAILDVLDDDQPHTVRAIARATGITPEAVAASLTRLDDHDVVEKVALGTYRLVRSRRWYGPIAGEQVFYAPLR